MSRARTSPGQLFVNLLGGFEAAGPQATDVLVLERKKTRALLAMLALDPGQMVARGKITTVLWAEQSEAAARHSLRQCLLDLRHVLAKAKLEAMRAEADSIGLDPSGVVVDAARFERQVASGTPEALEDAVALYRGELLEGFSINERAFEDWLRAERERLRSEAVGALRKLLAHYARQKATDTAVQVAIRLLALEPFDETVHRALMRFYADSGRRAAALRQYEACVEILARELGIEPEAETRELYRRLVPQRDHRPNVPATARSPRKLAPRATPGPVLNESTRATPFIGRQAEREWLDGLRDAACGGRPQLGLVLGEAGIGKSRLVEELVSTARDRRTHILLGRGREGEDILAFAPWIEALRPALSADVLNRLTPVTRLDLARLFPEIADGANPTPTGLEDGPRIFEAAAQVLRDLTVRHRLVIVIEDLHWCDDMTVRLLRFLPRRLEGRPVLLLATARPEETAPGRGSARETLHHDPCWTVTTLAPLSRDEATQLFLASLGSHLLEAPIALTERMWNLSEGNPFVVIACARAVRDRGVTLDHSSLQVPEAVRTLTSRSLDCLSVVAARVADVASVIGRDFVVALLQEAAGLSELELVDGVEELVRRRILREVDERFDFSHDRVREVVYGRLLGPRRVMLHRQVAEAIEAIYAADLDRHCAAIGAHYRNAGVWDRASTYLARAGFQAWERGAGREALVCFEDALRVINRLPDTAERRELHVHLRIAANGAHVALGSYERGRPHLLAAEKLAATLPDRRWEGRVAVVLCNSLRAGGMPERALALGRRAMDIAREIGDRGLESAGRLVLGATEENVGNLRRALEHLLPLVNDNTSSPDFPGPFLSGVDRLQALRATAHHWIAVTCVELGEFSVGLHLVKELLRETEIVSDALGTARLLGLIGLGRLRKAAGDFDAAIQAYEAARAIYRDDCHVPFSRALFWGLGLAYALAGRVAEGIELLEWADAAERKIGSRSFRPMRMLHIGRALLEAGRIDEAAERANDALTFALEDGNRRSEAGALGLLGEVALRSNPIDHGAMECHVVNALRLAEAHEMRPLAARCHLRLAWLYQRSERPESNRHAAIASSLLEQMGRPRSLDAAGIH